MIWDDVFCGAFGDFGFGEVKLRLIAERLGKPVAALVSAASRTEFRIRLPSTLPPYNVAIKTATEMSSFIFCLSSV